MPIIDHVAVEVRDLDAMITFYCGLGFTRVLQWDGGRGADVIDPASEARIELWAEAGRPTIDSDGTVPAATGPGGGSRDETDPGGTGPGRLRHLALRVADLAEVRAAVIAAGGTAQPISLGPLGNPYFIGRDPEGLHLEFQSGPSR